MDLLPPDTDRAASPPSVTAALLASRQRWQHLALLGADMVFETDRLGRFTLLEPARVLGHDSTALIGREASSLLMGSVKGPFTHTASAHGLRAWLAAADGTGRCLEFAVTAQLDEAGGFAGLRGIGRDISACVAQEAECRAATRRIALVEALLGVGDDELDSDVETLRRPIERLHAALGLAGAALLGGTVDETVPVIGSEPPPSVGAVARTLASSPRLVFGTGAQGEPIALVPLPRDDLSSPSALLLWRGVGAIDWDTAERAALPVLAAQFRVLARLREALLRHDRLMRHDPLSGLLNREIFLDALGARLERSALAGGGGALLVVDARGMGALNARHGREAGDGTLRVLAAHVADQLGGTDLAARWDDGVAIWLDGANEAETAARAAMIRDWVVSGEARPLQDIRIGAAVLEGGAMAAEALLLRAEEALGEARAAGGKGWHVRAAA